MGCSRLLGSCRGTEVGKTLKGSFFSFPLFFLPAQTLNAETPEPQSVLKNTSEARAAESPKGKLDVSAVPLGGRGPVEAAASPTKAAAPITAKSEVSSTPPLETSPATKKENRAQKQLDRLLELCVNKEAAGGLDVGVLVAKLHAQENRLEALAARLADERAASEVLRARLALLEHSERGAALAECERLRAAVAAAEAVRDHALNVLETLQAATLQQAAASAATPVVRKKVWKKAVEAASAPSPAAAAAVSDVPALAAVAEVPKKGSPAKRAKRRPAKQERAAAESVSSDSDVKEVSPPKRRKTAEEEEEEGFYFCDQKSVGDEVRLDEADLEPTADPVAHYQAFYKGRRRFAVGDTVYLTPPASVELEYVGRIKDVTDVGGVATVLVQWYFRWADLPDELQDGRTSALARKRELWLSDAQNENPAVTVVGRFRIVDGTRMKRPEVQTYTDASEHHFFTRKCVSLEQGTFVELDRMN